MAKRGLDSYVLSFEEPTEYLKLKIPFKKPEYNFSQLYSSFWVGFDTGRSHRRSMEQSLSPVARDLFRMVKKILRMLSY